MLVNIRNQLYKGTVVKTRKLAFVFFYSIISVLCRIAAVNASHWPQNYAELRRTHAELCRINFLRPSASSLRKSAATAGQGQRKVRTRPERITSRV